MLEWCWTILLCSSQKTLQFVLEIDPQELAYLHAEKFIKTNNLS